MRTKVLLFIVFVVTLTSLATVGSIIVNMSPDNTKTIIYSFLSIFASIFGLAILTQSAFYYLRFKLLPSWPYLVACFRTSLIFALLSVSLLYLSSMHVKGFISYLILVIIAVMAELYFKRRTSK